MAASMERGSALKVDFVVVKCTPPTLSCTTSLPASHAAPGEAEGDARHVKASRSRDIARAEGRGKRRERVVSSKAKLLQQDEGEREWNGCCSCSRPLLPRKEGFIFYLRSLSTPLTEVVPARWGGRARLTGLQRAACANENAAEPVRASENRLSAWPTDTCALMSGGHTLTPPEQPKTHVPSPVGVAMAEADAARADAFAAGARVRSCDGASGTSRFLGQGAAAGRGRGRQTAPLTLALGCEWTAPSVPCRP